MLLLMSILSRLSATTPASAAPLELITNVRDLSRNQVGCPYAQRVSMALELKRIEYARVEIDLQNKPGWLLEMNPLGRVPALLHDGRAICESLVICEYLEDAFPDACRQLLPAEPYERAQQRALIARVESRSVPAGFRFLCYGTEHEQMWRDELSYLDGCLSAGPFFGGDLFGMADVALAPFIERLDVALRAHRGLGIDAACTAGGLTALGKWWVLAKALPEFVQTSPCNDAAIAQVYAPESVKGQSYLRQ
jgi:glutathione S-transferase